MFGIVSRAGAGTRSSPRWIRATVVAVGIGIYVTAAIAVAVGADGRIRFTGDSAATIPMWYPWLPALTGITLALFFPPQQPGSDGYPTRAFRERVEALALIGLAVAFTVSLTVFGPSELNYILLKVGLLVFCPLLVFAATRRQARSTFEPETELVGWRPVVPVLGWAATYMALSAHGPAQRPDMDWMTLAVALFFGFFINAVVEELFYRKWLQTRWTRLLGGTWPAIIVSSLVWASWHIAIQSRGDLGIDLANTIVNQGVTGLFLGLLWARYRAMWPLLVTHGLSNANPVALFC